MVSHKPLKALKYYGIDFTLHVLSSCCSLIVLVMQKLLLTFLVYHQILDCNLSFREKTFRLIDYSTKVLLSSIFLQV